MVPYLNQKGTDTEGLSLILHLCMLCFASSILLLMVLIFMEDWRERERERHICQKNQCQFSYTTNCCWGMPLNMFYCFLLKWNLWKKGHFYILFFTLMDWLIGRSIHDWAKLTELHSWCTGWNEVSSYNIINSDRTEKHPVLSWGL